MLEGLLIGSTALTKASERPGLELLDGLVERVTFHNADSGYCVLRLKVRGERDLVTVVGHTPTVTPGEYASASGNWVTDREHGKQFRAVFLKIAPPNTLTGIERYLGSGMVKGIGPVYAGRLVEAFGSEVFEVIEQTPARLQEVGGIGKKRANKITSGWADQKVIREIMVFLHAHGVSTSRAVRIFKTYGQEAIAVVRDNPYRLARDIRGMGFLSADTIARKIGIALDSPSARAGGRLLRAGRGLLAGPLWTAVHGAGPARSQAARDPRPTSSRRQSPRKLPTRWSSRTPWTASRASSWRLCTKPSARSPSRSGA